MPAAPAGSVTKQCQKLGITARAVGPIIESSIGTLSPADDPEPLLLGEVLDDAARLVGRAVIGREEREANAVRARGRQRERRHAAKERVGHLDEDAGAVAGVDLGARCAAVVEVAERAEGRVDDVVALGAGDVNDEADAAGVVLEARVVETARCGQAR